jgi:hypothetical protein
MVFIQKTLNAGEYVNNKNPAQLARLLNGTDLMDECMVIPQKSKNSTTRLYSNSLLGIYPKEIKSICQRDIYTPMFIAALVTIANTLK